MSVSASAALELNDPEADPPTPDPQDRSLPEYGKEPPSEPSSGGGRSVAAAAGIMVAAILASRVLALVRDMVVSYYFGAGMVTDAYKAAFSLPDLLYYLIAGGALSSAFIPVFTEYLTLKDEDNAWKVFSVFGTVLVAVLTLVVILGEVFTPQMLLPLCPGFPPEKLALTVSLTRIILPAQIFFFLGGLMMSTLYARNHFLMPALGPVVYNIAIITGGMIGGASTLGIYGLAWGVIVGAFVGNVLMQVWTMRRIGVRYSPSLEVKHPGVVKVAKLMLPVLLGLSLPQICMILTRPFASALGNGPITWLDNANKIMQMPLGIFAQAVSVAIFPTLSALAAKKDYPGFRKQFSLGLRSILFLTIPSAVLIIMLAHPITAALFQRGKWTAWDTNATASAVVFYSFAIFAVSGQQIVNRGFYSMQNTLTPMIAGTVASFVFIGLNFALLGVPSGKANVPFALQVMKSNQLAISYSVSMILYLGALLVLFRRSLGTINGTEIARSVTLVSIASLAMGVVILLSKKGLDRALHIHAGGGRSLTVLLELAVCTALGAAVYLAAVKALKVPEAEFVFSSVGSRFGRLFGRRRAV